MQRKGKGALRSPRAHRNCSTAERFTYVARLLIFRQNKKARPVRATPFSLDFGEARLGGQFLGLVMNDRSLVQNLEYLGQGRLFIGLLHCAEFASQAR